MAGWESVDNDNGLGVGPSIVRLPVPGGWLYSTKIGPNHCTVFVPTPPEPAARPSPTVHRPPSPIHRAAWFENEEWGWVYVVNDTLVAGSVEPIREVDPPHNVTRRYSWATYDHTGTCTADHIRPGCTLEDAKRDVERTISAAAAAWRPR